MRALCGSIIHRGALIGLGLSALGVGTRYQNLAANDPASITYLKWVQLDTPMMLIIVVLLTTLIVGLGTAFVGLAYHHDAGTTSDMGWGGGVVRPLDALNTGHRGRGRSTWQQTSEAFVSNRTDSFS